MYKDRPGALDPGVGEGAELALVHAEHNNNSSAIKAFLEEM